MPTYNAKCEKCKVEQEYMAKIFDKENDLPDCPECKTQMQTAYMPACGGIRLNSSTIKGQSKAGSRLIKPMKTKETQ